MWDVYNVTREGSGRINNVLEGFSNKLKNIVKIRHLSLCILIESLNTCNASAITALRQKRNVVIYILR